MEVRRHVHKKAERAAADTDPGARVVASGIDYLRLVEQRHKNTMPAKSISFAGLAATAAADTGDESGTEHTR